MKILILILLFFPQFVNGSSFDDPFFKYPSLEHTIVVVSEAEQKQICLDLHRVLKESYYNLAVAIAVLKIVNEGGSDEKIKTTATKLKISAANKIILVQEMISDENLNCQKHLR